MALKILHLEDNPADAELVARTLRRAQLPCDLVNVDNADAYRKALTHEDYDVILSDSGIAGYDGGAALVHAHECRPGTPFIVVSGHPDAIRQAAPQQLEPTALVSKANLESLAAVIRSSVQRVQPQTATASERHARGTPYLISVIQALALARSLDTVMDIVRHAARKLVSADGASFVLREEDRCFYAQEDAIAPLWKGRRFPLNGCISGWTMLNRRATAITDVYADPRIAQDAYRTTFVKSLVMTPIRSAAPVGAIGVYWAQRHEASSEEMAVLTTLADSASVALESVDLIASLEQRLAERTQELRRRQSELEILNRELEAFTYSVSHDLRSPLITIDGFGHLLLETCGASLSEEARGFLTRITIATGRMQGLINDLLALSRIVRAPMHQERVDLKQMALTIAETLAERSPQQTVEFIAADAQARGDAGMLHIVLENLLSNAWKFTSKTRNPRIEFGVSERGAELTTFFVRDNGAGFDARYCANLFSPFHRLHSQEQFPGSGVGLATVRRIVNRHGGEIRATGEVDKGAVFYFSLPNCAAPE